MISWLWESDLSTRNKQGCACLPRRLTVVRLALVSTLTIFFLSSAPLYAQGGDPASKAAQEHERRLQEEAQRLQEQQLQQKQSRDIFLQPEAIQEPLKVPDGTSCFNITTINISGVSYFKPAVIDNLAAPFRNRCLGLSEINQLIKIISNLYIAQGLITSRAFLQPQNLSAGVLEILVVEGKLVGLESESLSHHQLAWAFPTTNNEPLNLRELEQGLEQLNRLQQNQAELDIQPGDTTGTSKVLIHNSPAKSWHAGVGANNSGSAATGEWLATAYLAWDNPLASNDNLYLNISDAQTHKPIAESKSYGLNYSLPYGYNLLGYNASYFNYQQLVVGETASFITSGSSFNQSLSLDRTIYRGQRDKVGVSASINRKQSKNYLADVFLETSSRTLYVTDIAINYSHSYQAGSLHSNLQWSESQRWFDATRELAAAERDYQFSKYTWDSNLSWALAQTLAYSSALSLFYSPKHIIASEALSLGGRYTVRGFEQSITGYRGGYWRNEIALQKSIAKCQFKPFVGIDVGYSDTPEYAEYGNATLASLVAGLRIFARGTSIDISYAESLHAPEFLHDRHALYVNAQVSF